MFILNLTKIEQTDEHWWQMDTNRKNKFWYSKELTHSTATTEILRVKIIWLNLFPVINVIIQFVVFRQPVGCLVQNRKFNKNLVMYWGYGRSTECNKENSKNRKNIIISTYYGVPLLSKIPFWTHIPSY